MSTYPKNRIYAIIPIETAEKFLGKLAKEARKDLAGIEIVWDWDHNDPILETLKKEPGVRLYTHEEILSIMSNPAWTSPEEEKISGFK